MTLAGFWYFIADIAQAIFKVMPWFGAVLNGILIAIGFIAFFSWIAYMSTQKEVTKWD